MKANRRLVLAIVETDATFERVETRDGEAWQGRCLFCNAKLVVKLDGSPASPLSIEHIVPQSAGGNDELLNVALACPSCNHAKGRHHDPKGLGDAQARSVVNALLARRRARWRDPS